MIKFKIPGVCSERLAFRGKKETKITIFEEWPLMDDPELTLEDRQEICVTIEDITFYIKKNELKDLIDVLKLAYQNIEKAEEMFKRGDFGND